MSRRRGVFSVKSWCGDSWAGQAVCEFARTLRDVVDKAYKPEYKWEMRRKNRYGMGRWSKEKRDKQQGQIKGVEMPYHFVVTICLTRPLIVFTIRS